MTILISVAVFLLAVVYVCAWVIYLKYFSILFSEVGTRETTAFHVAAHIIKAPYDAKDSINRFLICIKDGLMLIWLRIEEVYKVLSGG